MQPLIPFSDDQAFKDLQLFGDLQILDEGLQISFQLEDTRQQLVDPLETGRWDQFRLKRADELWKTTCFEVFFGKVGHPEYWELNLSPKGLWNLYHFTDYRSPQVATASADFNLIFLESDPHGLRALLQPQRPFQGQWEASLCAVLRKNAQDVFYYSLCHAGSRPDFHLRSSFSLHLTDQGAP